MGTRDRALRRWQLRQLAFLLADRRAQEPYAARPVRIPLLAMSFLVTAVAVGSYLLLR